MRNDSTIPIKANSISVYICRRVEDRMQILLMKREDSSHPDQWGVTQADVKPMEMCWQAALNEVRLDTSHVPDSIYSVDMVEQVYNTKAHCIMLSPVFVTFFDHSQDTVPMLPGVSSTWVDAYEAEKMLTLMHQSEALKIIYHEFFSKKPDESLKVYPTRF